MIVVSIAHQEILGEVRQENIILVVEVDVVAKIMKVSIVETEIGMVEKAEKVQKEGLILIEIVGKVRQDSHILAIEIDIEKIVGKECQKSHMLVTELDVEILVLI